MMKQVERSYNEDTKICSSEFNYLLSFIVIFSIVGLKTSLPAAVSLSISNSKFISLSGVEPDSITLVRKAKDLRNWQEAGVILSHLNATEPRSYSSSKLNENEFFNAISFQPEVKFEEDYVYFAAGNKTKVIGFPLSLNNVYSLDKSDDGRWVVYSAPIERSAPEIFVYDAQSNQSKRLTTDRWIDFSPVVNENGDVAWLESQNSSEDIRVYLNGDQFQHEMMDTSVIFNPIDLNNDFMVFGSFRFWDDLRFLYVYNLKTELMRKMVIGSLVPQKIRFISTDRAAVEVFDIEKVSRDVYILDCTNATLLPIVTDDSAADFLIDSEKDEVLVESISGSVDSMLIYHALQIWRENQLANPFAFSNNELGRLSWNQSYVLEGNIAMYNVTGHPAFLAAINNTVSGILAGRNEVNPHLAGVTPEYMWATRKYSRDRMTPLNFMVDNAKIIYPLMQAVNMNALDPLMSEQIISIASKAFDFYERDYLEGTGLYQFRRGENQIFDGVWLPYNMQNAFGLVLIELYRATGDSRYRDRVVELAKTFRSEWTETEDRVFWHYWPARFFLGWNSDSNISTNMPQRDPATNPVFEDVSHAGINVRFVHEFRSQIADDVFTDSDIAKLNSALERTLKTNRFTRFIDADESHTAPRYFYLPKYGWPVLKNSSLRKIVARGIGFVWPDLDGMEAYTTYAESFDGSLSEVQVSVVRRAFSLEGQDVGEPVQESLNWPELLEKFEIIENLSEN